VSAPLVRFLRAGIRGSVVKAHDESLGRAGQPDAVVPIHQGACERLGGHHALGPSPGCEEFVCYGEAQRRWRQGHLPCGFIRGSESVTREGYRVASDEIVTACARRLQVPSAVPATLTVGGESPNDTQRARADLWYLPIRLRPLRLCVPTVRNRARSSVGVTGHRAPSVRPPAGACATSWPASRGASTGTTIGTGTRDSGRSKRATAERCRSRARARV